MKSILLSAILLLPLALFSCEKNEVVCTLEIGPVEAMLQYSGPPAADGCGWLLEIDAEYYTPINLPEQFQKNEIQKVLVTFEPTSDKFLCGRSAVEFDKIRIKRITLF